jgi:hypothetical protein
MSYGIDVTVGWCYGNTNGYAVAEDSVWHAAFLRMMASSGTVYENSNECRVPLYDNQGKRVDSVYLAGMLEFGNITLLFNHGGAIMGACLYLGGAMKIVHVSYLNGDLRRLCDLWNRSKSSNAQRELVDHISTMRINTAEYYNDPAAHPLGSSFLLLNSNTEVTV